MTSGVDRWAKLPAEERARLERLLRGEDGRATRAANDIQPRPDHRRAPLSFNQERLWFLEQLEPENPAYQRPWALRLRGNLQPQALEGSLNEIVRRHEILRTHYTSADGLPVQTAYPAARTPLPVLDLVGLAPEAREARARQRIEQQGRRPIDLAHDEIFQPELIRLAPDDHVLFLRTHHIAFDGWSEGILLRELAELYPAALSGQTAPRPEPALQYADFAAWQRSPEGETEIRPHLGYWKDLFATLPARVVLPVTPPSAELAHWEAGRESLELDPGLLASIRTLARQEGATVFMVLVAGFLTLLHRLTGQTDLVIGYPSAGRSRRELEDCIGTFVEALPLRADLSGQPSFRKLLRRVRRNVLEGLAHQDSPFERLVAEVHPERSTVHAPLFDIFVNSHILQPPVPAIGDLAVEPFPAPDPAARYLLTLYIEIGKDPAAIEMVFKRALVPADDVRSWLREYRHLLRQVVQDADRAVSDYSLVPPEEAELHPDPRTPIPVPDYPPVMDQVEAWAERRPGSPAVMQGERTWSYQDLLLATREISAALGRAGIRPGDVVGVTGKRTFGLVAALLGSLQAGAVMLPLDPELPDLRLRRMQALARPRLILAAVEPANRRPPDWSTAPWWPVDPDDAHPIGAVTSADSGPLLGDGLRTPATIFFTSGTTGDPKAILGTREGLAHFITWQRETFEVGPDDRVALLTGLSFDVVLRDVLLPLASGGTLCLPPSGSIPASGAVLSWLDASGITLLHAVPSLAQAWLADRPEGVTLASLRWTFFAGEALTDTILGQWRRAFPEAGRCANLYGPTETTLVKCFHVVPDPAPPGIVPVGRPLPQTQALVLSSGGAPCGVGETGEIVIRTPFRSLGYLHPEGPEPHFRARPDTQDPHDLLYWTGDLARRLPDGALQFLGRIDDQVKIHGVRVEPAEVAATLHTHPDVSACAVVPLEGSRLAAYVVPGKTTPSSADLRAFLAARLPSAMVPSAFITLARLPLAPNGKLDRTALPRIPERPAGQDARTYRPPRDRLERQLAAIWEQVMGVESIGVADSFFDLGGHSLLAIQLLSRIEKQTGHQLPVRAIFEAPTIEGLAARIRRGAEEHEDSLVIPLQPEGRNPPIFWVHAAGGLVVSFARLAARLGPDQPSYAIQAQEIDGARPPIESINEMAASYIAEIKRVQPQGPYLLGGLSFGGLVAWEMARRLVAEGEEVPYLALLDTHGPDFPYALIDQDAAYDLMQRFDFHRGNLSTLGWRGRTSYVITRGRVAVERFWRGLGSIVRDLAPRQRGGLRRASLRSLWAARRARRRYEPGPYPGRVVLFRARVQPRGHEDPLLGWGRVATGEIEVHEVPGVHVSVMAEPHIRTLAEEILLSLERGSNASRSTARTAASGGAA